MPIIRTRYNIRKSEDERKIRLKASAAMCVRKHKKLARNWTETSKSGIPRNQTYLNS
jgi:hypothetical protein